MPEQWKVLLLMHFADPETVLHMAEEARDAKVREEFEIWAEGCPYLTLEDDGYATHHICRHPVRDDLSTWVMCDMGQCPMLMSGKDERLAIKDVRRFGIDAVERQIATEQSENAKMRELVRDMHTCTDRDCVCEGCPLDDDARCDFEGRMRDLGIEVDG